MRAPGPVRCQLRVDPLGDSNRNGGGMPSWAGGWSWGGTLGSSSDPMATSGSGPGWGFGVTQKYIDPVTGHPVTIQPGQGLIPGWDAGTPAQYSGYDPFGFMASGTNKGGYGGPTNGGNLVSWLGGLINTITGGNKTGGGYGNPTGTGTGSGSGTQPFSWGSLIPLGIGLGGSLLGSTLFGGASGDQKAATAAATNLANQQALNSATGRANSQLYTGMGLGPIANALNYWGTLASGDRTAMSSVLAPEISNIGTATANAFDTASQFAPRGGARTGALAQLPFDQAHQVSSMFQTLRPAAVSQLQGLGLSLADLGNTSLGGSTSAAASGANGYLNLVNTLQNLRLNQQQVGQSIGNGLYTWAKGVDWGKLFGGSGSGG